MEKPSIKSLKELLSEVEDPRVEGRTTHPLVNILVLGLATILSGGESFPDMVRFSEAKKEFFSEWLDMSAGVPSHDTFERIFELLDPKGLGEVLVQWTKPVRSGVVAIDGKTLRATKRGKDKPVHLVQAYAKEGGVVLGQLMVDEKSNEITALPELIRSMDLEDCIVTLDAMGTQKNVAKEIHEADADYLLALKANHHTAYDEIKTFIEDEIKQGKLTAYEEPDKGHGRWELRRTYQSEKLDWFADKAKWENLRSIVMVETHRMLGGKTSIEHRYFLSSLGLDRQKAAQAVRDHWSIENNLHWVLDVCFGEDRSQKSHKIAAQNLALLRKISLNIIKQDPLKDAIKGKRMRAAWDNNYLKKLLNFDA